MVFFWSPRLNAHCQPPAFDDATRLCCPRMQNKEFLLPWTKEGRRMGWLALEAWAGLQWETQLRPCWCWMEEWVAQDE